MNVGTVSFTIPSLYFKKIDVAKLGKGWRKVRRNLTLSEWRLAIWSPICLVKQSLIVFNKVCKLYLASSTLCSLPVETVFFIFLRNSKANIIKKQ